MSEPSSSPSSAAPVSSRGRWFVPTLCVGLVLFVLLNLLAGMTLSGIKVDATEERLYTLSDGARKILGRMDEPVTLKLYYSPRLGQEVPQFANAADRVETLLQEFARKSHGKLTVRILTPEPFSEAEDDAVAAGLQGAQLGEGGDKVYFGLVGTNSLDDHETIPFFQPEREAFLEYDLARMVHTLSQPERMQVGVLSTLPVTGDPNSLYTTGRPAKPWLFYQQLAQVFTVKPLPVGVAEIPAGLKVLVLIQPEKLPAQTLTAIDRFVAKGGNVLAFVDPLDKTPDVKAGGPTFTALLKHWGMALQPDVFVADFRYAQPVAVAEAGHGGVSYLGFLALDQRALDQDSPVTANLPPLTMVAPGSLTVTAGDGVTVRPLAFSSPDAATMATAYLEPEPDVLKILRDFEPKGHQLTLMAHSRGKIGTVFAPDDPALPRGDKTPDVNIIVVSDTDMLRDETWAQGGDFLGQTVVMPFAGNGAFIVNAVDFLGGDAVLTGLQRGGVSSRPFTVLEERQRHAERAFSQREQAVKKELQSTEAQLSTLMTQQGGGAGALLSPEQEALVQKAQQHLLTLRRDLRAIQRSLRQDVAQLEGLILLVNIALVPLVIVVLAVMVLRRRWRLF
jgi:ABC-type uncharacterized transport system involved in gliding motility auxiliary subunit